MPEKSEDVRSESDASSDEQEEEEEEEEERHVELNIRGRGSMRETFPGPHLVDMGSNVDRFSGQIGNVLISTISGNFIRFDSGSNLSYITMNR